MSEDITLPEAKYAHALDEFYGFLIKLAEDHGGAIGPGQRLVVLNTITPYSIVKGHPLYNTFVLRAYADLVVRRSSSAAAGSPLLTPTDIIDSPNSGDAWSFEYFRIAFPNLMQELKKYIQDPAVVAEIQAKEASWEGAFDAYSEELNKLEIEWDDFARKSGLDEAKNPTKYYQTKNSFYRKRMSKLQRLYDKHFSILMEISDLELAHLDSKGLLYKDLKDNLSTANQVKLPIRPEMEKETVSDPTKSPADYDIRPALYPAGSAIFDDLLDESSDGDEATQIQRGYSVYRNKKTTYTHDTDWGASGSASKFFFLRANLSISEKRHFEEQITKIGQIQVGFRAIQDVLIIRGKWYSGAFLKSEIFQKWLKAQPEFREKLRHLVTSVVVCRGLTLKLLFDSDIHQNSWRDLKVSGSGGLTVAGWNFGVNGHYNERTEWDLKDVTARTVTFSDGPKVCRVLGLKVEDVLGLPKAHLGLMNGDEIDQGLMQAYRGGKLNYGEFLEFVHGQNK